MKYVGNSGLLALSALSIPLLTLVFRTALGLPIRPSLAAIGGGLVIYLLIYLSGRNDRPRNRWIRVALGVLLIEWLDIHSTADLKGLLQLMPMIGVFHRHKELSLYGAALALVVTWTGSWMVPGVNAGILATSTLDTEKTRLLLQQLVQSTVIVIVTLVCLRLIDILHEWELRLKQERSQGEKRLAQQMASQWAVSVEAKHPYTAGHSERVTAYALALGCQIPDLKIDRETFELGGLLHDVGKIAIPDAILNNPGQLTVQEFRVIQSHTTRGHEMVLQTGASPEIAELVRHHHERWDGTGYPDGLRGTATPLAARVLGLADSFDAMTSERPYRRSLTPQEAHAEIVAQAGKQFDPALVAAIPRVIDEWLAIYNRSRPTHQDDET